MLLGLSSYTYGWSIGFPGNCPEKPMDELGLLDRAGGFGLKLVQVCDNLPLQKMGRERLTAFSRRAARDDVAIEVGSRGLAVDHVVEMTGLAKEVGAKLIRFVIDGPGYHPAKAAIVSILRECAPELGDITLGIENHDRFQARILRAIIEEVGSARIGICLDTANSLGAGEGLESVVSILAPVTVNLHIKDYQITRLPHLMGFIVEGRPAGGGMLDIGWLLDQLAPFGRCQTAVLELWTPPELVISETVAKEEAWAFQSVHYLRPFFVAKA